ncbi:MAG TPA: protein-glutamate O-methyltransferase CheR, partial [Blastocatellia bacterium]|nr:protein-glutamate O-methyltransferase CheR [Blastocatellia bacterium]
LAENYGWASHPALRAKINMAVANKAERLGIAPHEYCNIAAGSQSELLALVEEVATSETYFFREPSQFDLLRRRILPELMAAHPPNGKLRLWSAACSTGEEAYSLAIVFDLAKPHLSEQQVEVFATDLRNRALLEASRARYHSASLCQLNEELRGKYFQRTQSQSGMLTGIVPGGSYTVSSEMRKVVTFRRVNLLDRLFWKGVSGKFDLIVCANHLLFLHGTAARQMVANLANSLRQGGYLIVSPAEIHLVNSPLIAQLADETSFFRRVA